MFYKQCVLVKRTEQWHSCQSAWIPEQYAHEGKVVKIYQDGEWDDGWEVTHVGARQEDEYVLAHERDYLKQAQASDAVRDSNGKWKRLGDVE